jgi:hypothetical protein
MSERIANFYYECGGNEFAILALDILYYVGRDVDKIEIYEDSPRLVIIMDYLKNKKLKF